MNEETLDYRLSQIEKKVDQVTSLLLQQQEQQLRLENLEKKINQLEASKKGNIDRWLNPLVSAIVGGFVAFIFIRIGLK